MLLQNYLQDVFVWKKLVANRALNSPWILVNLRYVYLMKYNLDEIISKVIDHTVNTTFKLLEVVRVCPH